MEISTNFFQPFPKQENIDDKYPSLSNPTGHWDRDRMLANEVYENQLRFKFYEARINQPVPDSLEILERDYKPHSITNVEMYPGGGIKSVHCGKWDFRKWKG